MKKHFYQLCIVLFALNGLALGCLIFLRNAVHNPKRPMSMHSHFISGFNGHVIRFNANGCWILRYSGMNCHFCERLFATNWFKLENKLDLIGCKSYEISPNGYDIVLDGDTNPKTIILSVSPSFAMQTQFYRTPTTEVGYGHRVLWRQAGVFSSHAVSQCFHIIQTALKHQ